MTFCKSLSLTTVNCGMRAMDGLCIHSMVKMSTLTLTCRHRLRVCHILPSRMPHTTTSFIRLTKCWLVFRWYDLIKVIMRSRHASVRYCWLRPWLTHAQSSSPQRAVIVCQKLFHSLLQADQKDKDVQTLLSLAQSCRPKSNNSCCSGAKPLIVVEGLDGTGKLYCKQRIDSHVTNYHDLRMTVKRLGGSDLIEIKPCWHCKLGSSHAKFIGHLYMYIHNQSCSLSVPHYLKCETYHVKC